MGYRISLMSIALLACLSACGGHDRHEGRDGARGREQWHGSFGPQAEPAQAARPAEGMGFDAIASYLYPPPLVMRFGVDAGIAEDRMAKIRRDFFDTQMRVADLEPRVKKAHLGIQQLVTMGDFDEAKVAAQIDEATKADAEIKKQRLGLMLRIRQVLTPDERKKLDQVKEEAWQSASHAPPGPKMPHAAPPSGHQAAKP